MTFCGYAFLLWVTAAVAQQQPDPEQPRRADPQQPGQAETTNPSRSDVPPETAGRSDMPSAPNTDSIASSLGSLADPGGVRAAFARAGIQYSLTYIGEGLGNATGGVARGAIYEGLLNAQLDVDLGKLAGLSGLSLHATGFQIHGTGGLTRDFVHSLYGSSGIEALPSTRLYDAWLEQSLGFANATLRVGQLAADTEFYITQYGGLFVTANFGWPVIASSDLPSGGPIYPLATPGVRLKVAPTEQLTLLAAVFDGSPAGPGRLDPQLLNRSGTSFRLSDPPFMIVEAAYAYNQEKEARGLPGTFKLGAWLNLGRFDDQRFTATGRSLADPSGTGTPARLRGDPGIYAVLDQFVLRLPGGGDDAGVGVFARVGAAPSDRNLVDLNFDAGVTVKGLLPGRPDDTFGIATGYARISAGAQGLDSDTRHFGNPLRPLRSSERVIEVTYQAQIVPGWTVQPAFQYVVRPGGGVPDPRDPTGTAVLRDAAVFGLRTTIKY